MKSKRNKLKTIKILKTQKKKKHIILVGKLVKLVNRVSQLVHQTCELSYRLH